MNFSKIKEKDTKYYYDIITNIPLLSKENEFKLAIKAQKGDEKAREKLIISNLRYVAHIARTFSGYNISQADLIQEGNIGLMIAIDKFDITKGNRLSSFSVHWIKSKIIDYAINNNRIVRSITTKDLRRLFFNLSKMDKKNKSFTNKEADIIAKRLNVKKESVFGIEKRMYFSDDPYDGYDFDEDNPQGSPSYRLFSPNLSPELAVIEIETKELKSKLIDESLNILSKRNREIMRQRFLEEKKSTLEELSQIYNITAERIRQIESKSLKEMKNHLTVNKQLSEINSSLN